MFKIIIVGGPAESYIERCLRSVLEQTEAFHAQVVLDPVGDKTYEKAKAYESDALQVCLNEKQSWALPNILKCIERLKPSDEDILVTLDADDWFAGSDTLAIIQSYYEKYPDTLVTHGSWKGHPDPNCNTNCVAYTREDFNRGIRQVAWKGTHVRTMKYKIWKYIKDEDLRNQDGKYFRSAWDLAFMWPVIEMAGYERVKFISEKIYVYNRETLYNDEKLRSPEQQSFHRYLQSKKPYSYQETF